MIKYTQEGRDAESGVAWVITVHLSGSWAWGWWVAVLTWQGRAGAVKAVEGVKGSGGAWGGGPATWYSGVGP